MVRFQKKREEKKNGICLATALCVSHMMAMMSCSDSLHCCTYGRLEEGFGRRQTKFKSRSFE